MLLRTTFPARLTSVSRPRHVKSTFLACFISNSGTSCSHVCMVFLALCSVSGPCECQSTQAHWMWYSASMQPTSPHQHLRFPRLDGSICLSRFADSSVAHLVWCMERSTCRSLLSISLKSLHCFFAHPCVPDFQLCQSALSRFCNLHDPQHVTMQVSGPALQLHVECCALHTFGFAAHGFLTPEPLCGARCCACTSRLQSLPS